MLLVYSIIDEQSFTEMGRWLMELRDNLGDDVVVHVVGTKSDVVAQDPSLRKVPLREVYTLCSKAPLPGTTSYSAYHGWCYEHGTKSRQQTQ